MLRGFCLKALENKCGFPSVLVLAPAPSPSAAPPWCEFACVGLLVTAAYLNQPSLLFAAPPTPFRLPPSFMQPAAACPFNLNFLPYQERFGKFPGPSRTCPACCTAEQWRKKNWQSRDDTCLCRSFFAKLKIRERKDFKIFRYEGK